MIIITKESDIKKLNRWDPRVSQEYLDLIASMTDFIDADKISAVSNKWNNIVEEHIKKLDSKKVKEYEKKLLDDNAK